MSTNEVVELSFICRNFVVQNGYKIKKVSYPRKETYKKYFLGNIKVTS